MAATATNSPSPIPAPRSVFPPPSSMPAASPIPDASPVPKGSIRKDQDDWRERNDDLERRSSSGLWQRRFRRRCRVFRRRRASQFGQVDDDSFGIQILRDVREIWKDSDLRDHDQLRSESLCRALRDMEDRPWGGWGKHRPEPGLNMRDLARLLRPYGIRPKTVRFGFATGKGYKREQFVDPWRRYVPDEDAAEE